MKLKLCLVTLVGLAAGSLAAFAQTNPPAGDVPTAVASTLSTNNAAPSATPPPGAPPAEMAAAATTAPAAQPVAPGTIIPLIVMDEVPLTDAIKNLARQSGLNYMLDPKVSFGQVGPDGARGAQPIVSIRWENISSEQALNALLGNYSLQLVEDPKSKIARVTVKDPAAPDPLVTKIIQLKFSDPVVLVPTIQSSLTDKRSKVIADKQTTQLVVLATEKELVEVDQLVARLDRQPRQVLIEARLLETQVNNGSQKGVDWSGTLANQHVAFGNGALSGTTTTTAPGTPGAPVTTTTTYPSGRTVSSTTTPSSPSYAANTVLSSILGNGGLSLDTARGLYPGTSFLNADGVHAVLSFLNTYGETKIISSPRTVTLDNQPATIEVGTMFPIINVTAGTANTTGGSQTSYSNLTVHLEVTPRISANDFVHLKISPRIMRLGDLVTTTVGGVANSVYSFEARSLDTSVLIPSGNTLVMGGLISDNVQNQNTKVPVLGDIPVLGYLFRFDSKTRSKQNLTVFITPTIIQDRDYQPTKADFLKSPVPVSDSIEPDWSSWDSGKPKDWKQAKPAAGQNRDGSAAQAPSVTDTNVFANF